jgi:hypothetical protein
MDGPGGCAGAVKVRERWLVAEHEDVTRASRLGEVEVRGEPADRRMRVLSDWIGVDNGEVRTAKIEAVRQLALIGRKAVYNVRIGSARTEILE